MVRWEFRVAPLALLLSLTLIAITPLVLSLAGGVPLRQQIEWFGELFTTNLFRQITGYVALGLIAFEILYSLRKRGRVPLPGAKNGWRSMHILIGSALVPLIVIHTGGRWGDNLNGLLLSAMVGTILVGLVGKLAEALTVRRRQAQSANGAAKTNGNGNGNGNSRHPFALHTSWLSVHTVLVAALVALLGFHIFSVYYY